MRLRAHSIFTTVLPLTALLNACSDPDRSVAPSPHGPQFDQIAVNSGEGKIAFHSNRDGNFDIYVMNPDGSDVTQLTHTSLDEYFPIWSPDGTRLTFGRCGDMCDVVVINADGSGERTVFHGGFPGAWSPDGNRIAFAGPGGINVMNADGTGVVLVSDFESVSGWSRDGRQLLIATSRDGDLEAYALNLDGSGLIRITDNTANDGGERWSPDNSRIAFHSDADGDREIDVMNADGSGVTQLTHNDGITDQFPAWSPDGGQLVFESDRNGDTEIYVMKSDGSGVTQLTSHDGVIDGAPSWGRQVLEPNDDFASAMAIPALPFGDVTNLAAATAEASEPTPSCASFYGPLSGTVWYAFTPSETQSITARIVNAQISNVVAAYSGNAVTDLTQVGCGVFGGNATFRAQAGTTYYFQVAGLFGQGGQVELRLEITPPPIAGLYLYPYDPSVFDDVQLYDNSYDPAGLGIQSRQWDFGDGTSLTTNNYFATHRYAADGSYQLRLTVTTPDGRTGSTAQTLVVRTHDVAITKFSAPNAASAGQTRQISVGLSSKRYAETVEVLLFRSVPGGYQLVGSLTQSVPVRPANRTTDYAFSYTFSNADAQIGKVTFRAVANVAGARDALPADNETVAPPTKVGQ